MTGILFALSLQSPTRWARGCVRMSWHKWDVTNEMCANDLSPSVFHEWNVCGWVDTRYMSQMKCVRMSGHEWDVTNEILVNELTHRICHKCVRMSGHEWDVANEICVNELSHRICHEWNMCEWVVINGWMAHISIYGMSHMWICNVTHMDESRHTCEWDISRMRCHEWDVTLTDGLCHTCKWVMSHMQIDVY